MKVVFTVILAFCALFAYAQKINLNYKAEQMPYKFTITKFEVKNGWTRLYGKVTQKGRFSYSIDFDGATLVTENNETVKGTLKKWNNESKFSQGPKVIHNDEPDYFEIVFPGTSILNCSKFDLNLGTIQNREKTEIIFKDIPIKRKK